MTHVRRYLMPGLFALVLVTPFLLRVFLRETSAAAPAAGAVPLAIITSHAESIRTEFAAAFRNWHRRKYGTDVAIDYTAYGTGDIVRLFDDRAATTFPALHTFKIDLVWGGGDYLFARQLPAQNPKGPPKPSYLQPVTLDPAVMAYAFPKPTLNGLPLYDATGPVPRWYGAALSSFGITYNRDVLRYLDVPEPTHWADLTDPKLMGWFVAADPTRSASAKQAFMAVVEKAMVDAGRGNEDAGWAKGMGTLRRIAANTRAFVDGSTTIPGVIASGDAAAGMTIDYMGRTEAEAVGPRLGYAQPADETITNPDPIAMAAGAEHAETAKHFMEFVLGPDGQALWNRRAGTPGGPRASNLRRLPIAPAAYADPDMVDHDDPYSSAAGSFNKSNDREKTFNILGELLECSCMDCLDDLRDTRRAILAVAKVNPAKSKELDDRLGTFPFGQAEALARLKAYTEMAASPVDQLALLRRWTAAFKAEYAGLRADAAAATR